MKLLLSTVAMGLLLTACVSHDPEPVPEEEWQPVRLEQPIPVQSQRVVVQPVSGIEPAKTVVVEESKPTWWQTNRPVQKVRVVTPACPCKDPNDPCPQCYEK